MPARQVDGTPQQVSVCDVVGSSPDSSAPCFIDHVALSDEERSDLSSASPNVRVSHMRPPFQRQDSKEVVAIGSAELTTDERAKIELFIADVEAELKTVRGRDQYVVHPHMEEVVLGGKSRRRFSCAGFVLEAYRGARLDLVQTDAESLPETDAQTIEEGYNVRPGGAAESVGLMGGGPWRVLLPGYILNSLHRQIEAIRSETYQPRHADVWYPPKAEDAQEQSDAANLLQSNTTEDNA